ncbi:hypothetical protein N7534_012125 [Penicillium rubens]|nr:hypothetical protein N7534_012125 [Penicillium rubens]
MQGALSNGPPGSGLALYAPLPKPPGRWPPSTPDPQPFGELANLPGSLSPGKVPPAPCVHPAPRASRSAARFARRLRLHLTPSTSPAGAASSPPPRQLAPHAPPSQGREAPPAAPSPRGWGRGDRRWRTVTWGPACRGSYREGHPARAPTVTSPAIPAPPTQRDAATLAGPHSLSPGPLGPGRFYTDSPTPFGV